MDDRDAPDEVLARLEEQYFGSHMHEAAEIERLPSLLDGVTTFVDIGSSLGQYAFYAGRTLHDADIFCVEPDPFKASRLRELTERWERASTNRYHVMPYALSDVPGTLEFHYPSNHRSSGALFALGGVPGDWERVQVRAETLDRLFAGRRVDFVKVDVEGAEYRVLAGAVETLARSRPRILLEIAPWGDPERAHRPSDVLKLMVSHGYTFSIFESHYLFEPGVTTRVGRLKSRIMGLVLDRPALKVPMKKLWALTRFLRRR